MNPLDQFTQAGVGEGEEPGPEIIDDGPPPDGEIPFEPTRRKLNLSTLLMFGLLAVVGAGTYLMIVRAGAQTQSLSASAAAANTTIDAFLSGGAQNFQQRMAELRHTQVVVTEFNSQPSAHQIPLNELRTDPFTSPQFRTLADTPTSDANQEEEQRMAATDVVHGLKLQSIVFGSRSVCMINGRPYAGGQGNGAFTVMKILPQSVVVRVGRDEFQINIHPAPQD